MREMQNKTILTSTILENWQHNYLYWNILPIFHWTGRENSGILNFLSSVKKTKIFNGTINTTNFDSTY
jgi:hypothetical protein